MESILEGLDLATRLKRMEMMMQAMADNINSLTLALGQGYSAQTTTWGGYISGATSPPNTTPPWGPTGATTYTLNGAVSHVDGCQCGSCPSWWS